MYRLIRRCSLGVNAKDMFIRSCLGMEAMSKLIHFCSHGQDAKFVVIRWHFLSQYNVRAHSLFFTGFGNKEYDQFVRDRPA